MSAVIPACETLALRLDGWCLHLTFNRPEVRNALNERMWREISGVFSAIENDRSIRAVVLRGAGGFFCAGGDMKERATIALPVEGGEDPMFARNRMGGRILTQIDRAPQAVIAVVEGAAMGGGFGMVCVSDIAFAAADARFRMPEVTLGIPPAQISPFITRRIGQSQARRLALTAAPIDGLEAAAIGLVHEVCADVAVLNAALAGVLDRMARCAPEALAETKMLINLVGTVGIEEHLDIAARSFVKAVRGPEGREGAAAFRDKRKPDWGEVA
ncbi:MAG: enoyl-CoA hydratase/isomerase family protein [Betaproteobacteria bacterium]|nr:MAG: enoyl-CoA hydratase/isomerase family protein [Betaproteobacteria bacterium]